MLQYLISHPVHVEEHTLSLLRFRFPTPVAFDYNDIVCRCDIRGRDRNDKNGGVCVCVCVCVRVRVRVGVGV